MTIASKLIELRDAVENIRAAIVTKGAVLPTGSPLTAYPAAVGSISGGGGGWVRPSHWPALPEVDNRFSGLVRIPKPPNASAAGFVVTVTLLNSVTVQIDWGDGATSTIGSGAASHTYNWYTMTGPEDADGFKYAVVSTTSSSTQQPGYSFAASGIHGGWVDLWLPHNTLSAHAFYLSGSRLGVHRVRYSGKPTKTQESMFRDMVMLREVDLRGAQPISLANWFNGCALLEKITGLDTSLATLFNLAFYNCNALRDFSWISFAQATDMSSAFVNCYELKTITINTPTITSLSATFNGCLSLRRAEVIAPNATSAANCFIACPMLTDVTLHTKANAARTSTYTKANMLSWINDLSGSSVAMSVASCNLNAAALNKIFTDLGTVASGTIVITGTPGAATCDRSIAIAKGWTVTG